MIYLEVAVTAPIDHMLTYSLPESLFLEEHDNTNLSDYIGRRVVVPLGNRRVTGYILHSYRKTEVEHEITIKPIVKFLDPYPLFHNDFVDFLEWIAKYYHYPIGLVVKTALPGGLAPRSGKKINLTASPEKLLHLFNGDEPEWIKHLCQNGELTIKQTRECFNKSTRKKIISRLEREGAIACVDEMQKDGVSEKHEICYEIISEKIVPPDDWSLSDDAVKKYRQELHASFGSNLKVAETKALSCLCKMRHQTNKEKVALKDLRKLYKGVATPLASLVEKEIISRSTQRVYRSTVGEQLRYYPRPERLTDQQQSVLEKIIPAIRNKSFQPFLLHGVTGSGKTEVYLQAIEETLACSRDVIVLVPEIALATQLEAHLVSRFGNKVVLLHSGIHAAEKYDQYYLALSGRAKIAIGARSAVFAPFKDPGLIIVDEEHDSSYKQDEKFLYNGRDIAVVRAKNNNCVVILGSATPSITSFNNARIGKYTLLSMEERVGDSVLPSVTLVNIHDLKTQEPGSIIGKQLKDKLQLNIKKEKQSILLLNRRGFSTALLCRNCGTPVQCDHCNVSLTLHKEKNRLLCHYCGFTQIRETICIQCRSTDLVPAGFGTERVEDEILRLIPEARVSRLDSDTAADRKRFIRVLSEMYENRIDILIGTQMIAKGHHFPNVTLVGVVWADGGMSMPDYKAAERAFQLITQVTGRAGRAEHPGEVIIQTLRPEHYAIRFAQNHDYENFYNHEMQLRRRPAFPPFVRLVLLRIQGRVENQVRQSAAAVARFCRDMMRTCQYNIDVLGPAPSPLDKVKDNFRWQVLLKGCNVMHLQNMATELGGEKKKLMISSCSLIVDIDPESMM